MKFKSLLSEGFFGDLIDKGSTNSRGMTEESESKRLERIFEDSVLI